MKVRIALSLLFLVAFMVFAFSAVEAQNTYVGVKSCKMCHNKAKTGKQFSIWSESGHAKAFETLATEEAKAVAKKAGVEGDPQKADQCLSCHVTGHGASSEIHGDKLTMEEGVSCEACHGPGSAYKSMKVMKDITAGTIKGETVGLTTITAETCKTCHNPKSPTYKEFNFDEAAKKIAHPIVEIAE
ncbi:cytochrome C554 [candidate division KSB1 bacterium]|nr:cytochrome C554 [candidate division KSB1 bacterium]